MLPLSGQLSMRNVNTELSLPASAQLKMSDSVVRTLFARPSGEVRLSHGYGKSNIFLLNVNSNSANMNLRTAAVSAGWDGSAKIRATIGAGITIFATTTSNPALLIAGSFPNGLELINNGSIIGAGGGGGGGGGINTFDGVNAPGGAGGAGGTALGVQSSVTVTNSGSISGGGGGGGGGGGAYFAGAEVDRYAGGGGGGGGRGNSPGGGGGGGNMNGADGSNGGGGSTTGGGAGGGGFNNLGSAVGGGGGGGSSAFGGAGAAGAAGWASATGGFMSAGGAGGAGGAAVVGNSLVNWISLGTIHGVRS